ncbi:MAG: hypothetical protein DLM58_15100 [Pseudonocardiales bacterium]|nr:MAG: hypothetical protein DLM58_15100 [Pseudonocardiales bacterium]
MRRSTGRSKATALGDTVTWTEFAQDHRPGWDYFGFGPFVFDRLQYERAIAWMVAEFGNALIWRR